MQNWTSITAQLEHALTLDEPGLRTFLATLGDEKETLEITRLLQHCRPATNFLATTAADSVSDELCLQENTQVGLWKIDKHIGRGGMGDVYRAHRADGLYEQTVALKVIQSLSAVRAELFEIERRRLALMDHSGIARIIDGGTYQDERPYLVMEFVDGVPITTHVVSNSFNQVQRLALFRLVCDAVEHAHSKLVLHRDIKSDNVLIGSDGSPRLIDFGISSNLDDNAGFMGALTIATAAPEQLKAEPISVQTDVFALGVLLHEILTGRKPTRTENGGMKTDESAINNHDLNAIMNRALAFDPSNRYVSATAMSEDISAFLDNRPVVARSGGWAYSAMKFLQRYPFASALAAIAVLALSGGLATSLKFAADAQDQADNAETALYKANWQFGRSEANMSAQQAYSDVLQRAFGGDEDVDRLTDLLMQRWREAFAARKDDPETAAALSYAVGRNFYFRGDTATALMVFDPWMDEGFGPKPLVALAEEVYAMMLSDAGRITESTQLFVKLVDFYGDGSLTSEADASNYANRLARLTRAPQDIARSISLIEARLKTVEGEFNRLFSVSQLAGMRTLQKDFDGAMNAYAETVKIFEQNPGFAAYGRDIARINLASISLAWRRDLNSADALVTSILTEDVPLKGESIQKARALLILAIIESDRGEHNKAVSSVQEAIKLFARFGGEQSALYLSAKGVYACILMRSDQTENALEQIAMAQRLAIEANSNERSQIQLRLLSTYIKMLSNKIENSDRTWLAQEAVHTEMSSNLLMLHFYRSMAEKGYGPQFWQKNAKEG